MARKLQTKKESPRELKARTTAIVRALRRLYPGAKPELDYRSPFELLVATILSAQCTDVRVNIVTRDLFSKYNAPEDFAGMKQETLEGLIRSTGFYRNKARNIIACSRGIVERFGGSVPDRMDDLTTLAGVGRKTANCVLGGAFGIREGIVVDTHVARLSARLGLTTQTDPEKIERDLMALVPRPSWFRFSNSLILHGRRVCKARMPACESCGLRPLCPSARQFLSHERTRGR